ncbi:MAG: Calx-beta domain-containing protein, partial [Fibrobacterota bacterium]|nr:Calx-beta domain-containing protein [Chitinispirillaceae bacterium]
QQTLEFKAGDTVTFSTPPVKDDVLYVWDLHDRVIKDYKSQTKQMLDKEPSSSVGEVYVIDWNDFRSPSSFFLIRSSTTTAKQVTIRSLNDSLSKDTIFSKTPSLQVITSVAGIASLKEVSVNGIVNSQLIKNADGSYLFYTPVSNIDSLSPITLIVKVTDNTANVTLDTLIVKYTHTIINTDPVITVQNPSRDSSNTNNQNFVIQGRISNSSKYRTGTIFIYKNGNLELTKFRLNGELFIAPLILDNGRNEITVKYHDDTLVQSTELASKNLVIMYDPTSKDTIPPNILLVLNDNKQFSDSMQFNTQSIPLRIFASDNTIIASVFVNGKPADLLTDSAIYAATATLTHPYSLITVIATDIANLSDTVTYRNILFNRAPSIKITSIKTNYLVDSVAKIKVAITDPDNDTLSVTAHINGTLLIMGPDSTFTLKPALRDTGWQDIKFQVYDKYETVETTVKVSITKASDAKVPVQWLTNGSDIKDTLYVGLDTLQVSMKKNTLSNMPPFYYKVEFIDISETIYSGNDSNLIWVPQEEYLGNHQIRFTISDSSNAVSQFTDNIVISKLMAGIKFEKASSSCNENADTLPVNVILTRRMTSQVTVNFAVDAAQTTASTLDYTMPVGTNTLVFSPGDTLKTIQVTIQNNNNAEQDERITLKLSGASSNAYLDQQSSTVLTILDDDHSLYSFTTSQGQGTESTRTVNLTIRLSKALTSQVQIRCTVDSLYTTASTNSDFVLNDRSVTFAAGETEKTIQLTIYQNSQTNPGLREQDEYIGIRLSSTSTNVKPGDITLYKYTIIGTNTNAVKVYLNNAVSHNDEYDHEYTISIRRDAATSPVSIYFAVNKELSTADSSSDFRFVSPNPLVIPQGIYSGEFKIRVLNDTLKENDETIVIDITKLSTGYAMSESPARVEYTIYAND